MIEQLLDRDRGIDVLIFSWQILRDAIGDRKLSLFFELQDRCSDECLRVARDLYKMLRPQRLTRMRDTSCAYPLLLPGDDDASRDAVAASFGGQRIDRIERTLQARVQSRC